MLSTRRAIVNHPHYEDVALRQKTRKVYQMYSRRSPEEYKQTLKELQVHYVVLHSGWCLEKPWVLIYIGLKIIGFEKKNVLAFFSTWNQFHDENFRENDFPTLALKTKPKVPDDFRKKKNSFRKEGDIFFLSKVNDFFFESDFPAIVYCLMLLPKVCYVAKPSNT